jgi:hypothetical protein
MPTQPDHRLPRRSFQRPSSAYSSGVTLLDAGPPQCRVEGHQLRVWNTWVRDLIEQPHILTREPQVNGTDVIFQLFGFSGSARVVQFFQYIGDLVTVFLIEKHELTGLSVGKGLEFVLKSPAYEAVVHLSRHIFLSVRFNIACGRCRNCREGKTGICLNVNGDRAGAAFGYVDMGGWVGGQADYVMAHYADFNRLKFPDKDQALEKIEDLTLLSDIFPTGYDGAVKAGVTTGSAGPVGLADSGTACPGCEASDVKRSIYASAFRWRTSSPISWVFPKSILQLTAWALKRRAKPSRREPSNLRPCRIH